MTASTQSPGYIALMTVLITGAVTVAIGLALLVAGTDSQRAALVSQQTTQSRTLATACAEEALQQINDNINYVGVETLTTDDGSCTYTVVELSENDSIISVTATVNNVVNKQEVYVTMSQSSITITSWQEVSI